MKLKSILWGIFVFLVIFGQAHEVWAITSITPPTVDFNYFFDNNGDPQVLTITGNATGSSKETFCESPSNIDSPTQVTEYPLDSVNYYISGGPSGGMIFSVVTQGQDGFCSVTHPAGEVMWAYNIGPTNVDVSGLPAGDYTLTVQVFSNGGKNGSMSKTITINRPPPTGTVCVISKDQNGSPFNTSWWTTTAPPNGGFSGGPASSTCYTSEPTGTYSVDSTTFSNYTKSISPGSANLSNGSTITFNITYTANSCTSSPNACGQTNTGVYQQDGTCSATTPANPANYGSACTSSANACGQTNTGTIQCNGSCSATTPANPANYGSACTSSANACGQTNTGTIQCNGTCSATTPANPAGYGSACTSSANACGQTNTGTIQCNGTCSATTPANTCSSTANISASPNPIIYNMTSTLTWSSANTFANSCSITGGPVSGGSTGLPTSGSISTSNLTANTTYTVTCNGFNGSPITASVTVNVGAAPAMNYFRCNGVDTPGTCTIGYGGTATITWSSSNTTNCSLVSTVPTDEGVGPSGSNNYTNITSNRNYSIECWNGTSGVHAPALSMPLHVVVSGPSVDIKANDSNGPITLAWNSSANLSWTSSNDSSCAASGDWSGSEPLSGSQSTGNLTNPKTYNYTLSCSGNGSASDTVQVILNPPVPNDPTNITAIQPDYCVSGPAATVGWTYSDPSGSPQSAYEVQVTNTGNFNNPVFDSGKINSSSNSYFTGQGILQFNTTYKARVRTWNSYDVVSDWSNSSNSWKTPSYAYPQTDFYWTANGIQNNPSPPLNKPVQFTDQTVFSDGKTNGHEWSWTFGDGATSTTENPSHTYTVEGSYYVTLTATDNANQTCSRTHGPLIIQKPIPRWREVAPR